MLGARVGVLTSRTLDTYAGILGACWSGASYVPINAKLPADKIEILGPPPTSGTRDAFLELVMEPGAKTFPFVAGLDKDAFTAGSHTLREDGAYIEAGENDNLIVQKLEANPHQLGIFGYSFLEQNADKIQG